MSLIRKIIIWIKRIIKKWFGKKKISKKIKTNYQQVKNKKYLKGYGLFLEEASNETFPIYLTISEEEKQRLIDKIVYIKQKIEVLPEEEQKKELEEWDKIVKKINKSKISFYQSSILNEKIDNYIEEKNYQVKEKSQKLYKDLYEIIDNFDETIKNKVEKEYRYVNYVTLTTLLLDETKKELLNLEDNFKKHKYNKSYYDREINKIKMRIQNLKKIRDSKNIQLEIEKLKKDLYTKSKDKYDLLYNEEIFLSITKECNDLLKRVDRRIIDIRKKQVNKDNEKEKKEEKKQDDQKELLENIIKRFQDIELAKKILFLNEEKVAQVDNLNNLLVFMDNMYMDFINGEKVIFNYERNKAKTELVKLYNNINKLTCILKKEEYISIEHINYQLEDLVVATQNKKLVLEDYLEQEYNYKREKHELSILVNNKLDIISEKENKNEQILVKTNLNKDIKE